MTAHDDTSDQNNSRWKNIQAWIYDKSAPDPLVPLPIYVGWICFIVLQCSSSNKLIPLLAEQTAVNFYDAIASSSGSLLGFLITAATIFITLPHERVLRRFAQKRLLEPLFNIFIRAIICSAITLVTSLSGLFGCASCMYAIQILTLVAASLTLAYLVQSVRLLTAVGQIVLHKIQNAVAAEEKAAKEEEDREKVLKTGPPGTV